MRLQEHIMRRVLRVALAVLSSFMLSASLDAQRPRPPKWTDADGMSPMGHRAAAQARARAKAFLIARGLAADDDASTTTADICDDNGCDPGSDEDGNGPASTQSEMTIAVDATGTHVRVGLND